MIDPSGKGVSQQVIIIESFNMRANETIILLPMLLFPVKASAELNGSQGENINQLEELEALGCQHFVLE